MYKCTLFFILFLTVFPNNFTCFAVRKTATTSSQVLKFMEKYGYLKKDKETSAALYTEVGFSDILKIVQRYGAINETGKLDNATIRLISSRRCGNPDFMNQRVKRYTFGSEGWRKRHLTYYISNRSRRLNEEKVAQLIGKALNTWGAYGDLRFERKFSSNEADIIVSFAKGEHNDPFPFDGPGYVLAHAFFPNDGSDLSGDIHFDEDEDWVDGITNSEDDTGTDFYSVALHELGHSLGLGHSNDPSAVMFPYYRGDDGSAPRLGNDDVAAMYQLYIARSRNKQSTTVAYKEYTDTTKKYTETTSLKEHDHSRLKIPDICTGNYDSVANLRGELFVFKGNFVWRLRNKFEMVEGYPVEINRMFRDFSEVFGKIDAAYERPDGNMVFFSGSKYWVFDGLSFVENSPRNISDYGVKNKRLGIDAVLTWRENGKTYLFQGKRFIRYDEEKKVADDEGYIRDVFGFMPVGNLDAALTWRDGQTYFFKNDKYWMVDSREATLARSFPKDWLSMC